MSEPIIGSVELHNVKIIFAFDTGAKIKCKELGEVFVPNSVVDPRDASKLKKTRTKKKTLSTTIRVLKWWFVLETTGKTSIPKTWTEPASLPTRLSGRYEVDQ